MSVKRFDYLLFLVLLCSYSLLVEAVRCCLFLFLLFEILSLVHIFRVILNFFVLSFYGWLF